MEIVWPTDKEGDPLSAAMILRLQVWADAGAVKLRLQFAGKPEPVTVIENPHEVPLLEQAIVWPPSTSVATPSVWLYTDPLVIVILEGVVDHVGL